MEAFIAILMIGVVAVIVAAVKSGGSSSDSAWSAAAVRLGLEFDHADMLSSPTITGTRRGMSVDIDTFSKSGDDNRIYTRYRVRLNRSLGLGLRLVKQGPMAFLSRKLGTQDIDTGDNDFDDTLVVKGRDPEAVIDFLTPTRRLRIVRFLTLYPGSSIDDTKIETEERNVARSPDHIVQTIQRMTTLAELLSEETPEASGYLAALTVSDETTASEHESGFPSLPGQEGVPLLHSLIQDTGPTDEVWNENTRYYEPEPIEVVTPPAMDPACDAEGSEEQEKVEVSPPSPQKADAVELTSSDIDGLPMEVVLSALFDRGYSTAQTTELFEDRFKGRSVAWSGTLSNVRSYRFDLVFGDTPGTRAEVVLIDVAATSIAARATTAVVQFGVEAEDELRGLVDKHVSFSGVLFSCDAFLKTLFLANGRVSEVDG